MIPRTLGASSVGAVLGVSPFAGPWDVWAELTGLLPREDRQTGPMWLGTVLEDHIRERWAAEQGLTVIPGLKIDDEPIIPTDDGWRWRHARPDGFIELERAAAEAAAVDLVEIKTVLFDGSSEWGEDGTDQIPVHYQPQIVHQADVVECAQGVGVRGTHVIACDRARGDLRTYWIPHDRERARKMRGVLRAWYDRHILGGEQPDPDASEACRLAAAALYAKPRKEWLDATEADEAMVRDLRELRAYRDQCDNAARVIENRLRLRIASAAGIKGLVSWTHRSRAGKPSAGQLTLWSNDNV